MSVTVTQTWVHRFHDVVNIGYATMDSLVVNLLNEMMVHRDVRGAIDHHERLDHVIAQDMSNPFGPPVYLNPGHDKRAVTLVSSDATVLISDEHTLRGMVELKNPYTQLIIGAIKRRSDKHVIDALVGNAQVATVAEGTGVITYSNQALPSARKAVGSGTTNAIALLDIIAAGEALDKSGVPQMGRIALYGPGQTRNIMLITQAASSDFTRHKIHDTGTINGIEWEGFRWKMIPDLVKIDGSTVAQRFLPYTAGSPNLRTCIFWHPSAVGLSLGRASEQPSVQVAGWIRSHPIEVRQPMMQNAVRVFEGGVFALDVLEN